MNYNNVALHDEKVIFFFVAKAANSSIKAAIKRMKGERVDPATLHVRKEIISPCQALEMQDYIKIGIVRNPWDRFVSCYYQKIIGPGKSGLLRFKGATFERFVDGVCSIKNPIEIHIVPQVTGMVCDGMLVPDKIIKFEELNERWPEVQAILPGLPSLGNRNAYPHPPYRECYTEETKEKIGKLYAEDIRVFDYEF